MLHFPSSKRRRNKVVNRTKLTHSFLSLPASHKPSGHLHPLLEHLSLRVGGEHSSKELFEQLVNTVAIWGTST
jgi:hypothetical protein